MMQAMNAPFREQHAHSRHVRIPSKLLPSFIDNQQQLSQRTNALHGRLEELLVFEIKDDG